MPQSQSAEDGSTAAAPEAATAENRQKETVSAFVLGSAVESAIAAAAVVATTALEEEDDAGDRERDVNVALPAASTDDEAVALPAGNPTAGGVNDELRHANVTLGESPVEDKMAAIVDLQRHTDPPPTHDREDPTATATDTPEAIVEGQGHHFEGAREACMEGQSHRESKQQGLTEDPLTTGTPVPLAEIEKTVVAELDGTSPAPITEVVGHRSGPVEDEDDGESAAEVETAFIVPAGEGNLSHGLPSGDSGVTMAGGIDVARHEPCLVVDLNDDDEVSPFVARVSLRKVCDVERPTDFISCFVRTAFDAADDV